MKRKVIITIVHGRNTQQWFGANGFQKISFSIFSSFEHGSDMYMFAVKT